MADFVVSIAEWWQVVRFPLGAALCLAGALLCVVGTVGVLRFPDFYTRLHAASVTDTSGATLLLLGMALMAPDWTTLAHLLMDPTGSLETLPASPKSFFMVSKAQ